MFNYLDQYNDNLFIKLIIHINSGLNEISRFLGILAKKGYVKDIEDLVNIYEETFINTVVSDHISFKIEQIYKSLYLTSPGPFTKGNSYYHLTLSIKSNEAEWLDNIYDSRLTKLLRFFKVLFSNIDNFYLNNDLDRIHKYRSLITEIQEDIQVFIESTLNRDIIEKGHKLDPDDFKRIPFGGLFYMAHIDNLKSILEIGILSHNLAHHKGIVNVDISNREINAKRKRIEPRNGFSIHDYAPLYITPKNPMHKSLVQKQTIGDIVFLKVNPHILLTDKVLFSDGNAAEESTKFFNNISDFNKLYWECINDTYWEAYKDGKRIKCSEVLILHQIPNYYISEIFSKSEATLKRILNLFPNHLGIVISSQMDIFDWGE